LRRDAELNLFAGGRGIDQADSQNDGFEHPRNALRAFRT
jgi:hypothetical protein